MALAPSPPPARGAGVDEARRKLLLDDLVADRTEPDGLAEPVLSIDPVSLDAIPRNRGRHRIEDVEEAVARNLRSAEEARQALRAEHSRLEAEAVIRRKMEREVGALRREIERMQESEKLRVAQARYTAEREARDEVLADVEQVKDEYQRAAQEIDRLRRALDGDRVLMAEFSDRLREEQQAKAKAQAELDRALDAARQAEQRWELSTETARRRADDELSRLADAESALRDALAERDALALQVSALSAEDGRGRDLSGTVADLEHLVSELEAALAAERLRTDTAVNHAAELTEEIDAMQLRREDELRSIAVVEQLEAELEGAVAAHGAAVDRVRAIDQERSLLEARMRELSEAHAELIGKVEVLERDFDTTMRERDSLLEEVNELRTGRAGDLAAARESSKSEVRELEHMLTVAEVERDSLVQEASGLRQELATLAKTAHVASASDGHHRQELEQLENRLGDAVAVRDTYAKQVRDLEASLAQSSEHREDALRRTSELERALSEEQGRVRQAEEELRRLRTAASVDAPAATGRAEPAAAPAATGRAEPAAAPAAAPKPAPTPEPEPEAATPPPDSAAPPAPVVRRSALAELHSIAKIDDEGFRRRR
jgi:chromosome segregation ATPase